jgi:hypothetical protein
MAHGTILRLTRIVSEDVNVSRRSEREGIVGVL